MAQYDFQVVLQGQSDLPGDVYVNTLHFEVNAPDTVGGTCDGIEAAYRKIDKWGGLGRTFKVKAYAAGPPPRQPVEEKSYDWSSVGAGASGPPEIACCLSYATVDDPASSTPRRRGRVYIGPISSAETNNDRPKDPLQNQIKVLGTDLASIGTASNTTWLMYSQTDHSYHKIEVVWVDDAWDIQRRRGNAPTARKVADVQ